jgi:hypothetical protein
VDRQDLAALIEQAKNEDWTELNLRDRDIETVLDSIGSL